MLLIDVINDLEFPRGNELFAQALPIAPKHSGFYQTPLELLLKHLGTQRLVLAGVSTNSCVPFTANDAYMRDLQLAIPRDCVAAYNCQEHDFAMEQMKSMLKADTKLAAGIDLRSL